jgi:hypothetical protein
MSQQTQPASPAPAPQSSQSTPLPIPPAPQLRDHATDLNRQIAQLTGGTL